MPLRRQLGEGDGGDVLPGGMPRGSVFAMDEAGVWWLEAGAVGMLASWMAAQGYLASAVLAAMSEPWRWRLEWEQCCGAVPRWRRD
jgi:hypothetical protein